MNNQSMVKTGLVIGILIASCQCFGQLHISEIFQDNMVLQENTDVPIWGQAKPHVKIVITADWLDSEKNAFADENGNWTVYLPTPEASFSQRTFGIKSEDDEVKYSNILIGQVWLCSGQSNMAFSLDRTERANEEIAKADFPNIRLFQGKPVYSDQPRDAIQGSWQPCKPDTAAKFSGVGYYFGKELFQKLHKPIGLINLSWGGTPVEAWMRPEAIAKTPEFEQYLKTLWARRDEKYPQLKQQYDRAIEQWQQASQSGQEMPKPNMPLELRLYFKPSYCYNGMIAPIKGFAIAGVIWYQGEANTPSSVYPYYCEAFTEMIRDWRNLWRQDFPFLYVQLAASTGYKMGVAHVRQAQMRTLDKVPNVGMAVTMDIGDANDHHPLNKRDVGYRLSLWALKNAYGCQSIVPSGPIYLSKKVEGNKIRLFFDYVGDGLMAKNGELTDFAVCGPDHRFYPAKATIDSNTILVWSEHVPQPEHASFAWCEYAEPNFYNKNGLPASPFNTYELELLEKQ